MAYCFAQQTFLNMSYFYQITIKLAEYFESKYVEKLNIFAQYPLTLPTPGFLPYPCLHYSVSQEADDSWLYHLAPLPLTSN